jgi:hypothetical protein
LIYDEARIAQCTGLCPATGVLNTEDGQRRMRVGASPNPRRAFSTGQTSGLLGSAHIRPAAVLFVEMPLDDASLFEPLQTGR